MKYQGSKRRIAKDILEVIFSLVDYNKDTIFYDVFTGGGNLIQFVPLKNRIGIDNNCYVIEALKVIRDSPEILPKDGKEFTETNYNEIKSNPEKYPKWLIGYVGVSLSWGGKWFGGWRRGGNRKDYVKEAYNSAIRQSYLLKGAEFVCADYREVDYIKQNSIIYCDPPYYGKTKYKNKFEHESFWNWARKMSENGYKVFISELQMPDDFVPIWGKIINSNLSSLSVSREKSNLKPMEEKLFVHKSFLEDKNVRH